MTLTANAVFTIRGSWGDLTVDRATGHIIAYDDHGKVDWSADDVGYHDIAFVLPETLAPGRDDCLDTHGETDILCVGFVDVTGTVTMPMQRDEYAGMLIDPAGLLTYLSNRQII